MAKTYVDNFNRTANLPGSTSSDTLFTWSELLGNTPTTNGAEMALVGSDSHNVTSANCDTDNVYVEVDVVSASGPFWLTLLNNGTYPGAGTNGYEIAFVSGTVTIYAMASGAFNTVGSASHTVTAGTYRVEYNKGTGDIVVSRNGTSILTSNDTSEPGGSGNRRAGIGGNNGGGTATFDIFKYGDIGGGGGPTPTSVPRPSPQLNRRASGRYR